MRPIAVVLLDGLGDRAYPELGGATANEAAATPHLDAFAARGSTGLLWPLGPGRAPSSELAHWAMLGYRGEEFPGRAVLEALGWGRQVDPDRAYAYATLRPAEARDGKLWVTGRPGEEDRGVAEVLVGSVARYEVDGFEFVLRHLSGGQGILAVAGPVSSRVTDTDPFFRDRDPVLRPRPQDGGATRMARAVEAWTLWAAERLRAHRVNEERRRRGLPALNVITLKWWGRPLPAPSFVHRHGLRGAIVGASTFLGGLAEVVGLDFVRVPETPDAGADLSDRLERVAELLEAGATFVLSHQKATDEAGHTKRPRRRLEVIEAIDRAVPRLAAGPFDGTVVCATGDHATPAAPEVIHSGDPVPFLVAGPGVRADDVQRFGERFQVGGILGHLGGEDVMPVLLNAADRARFMGSRPTNVAHALGHPALAEALEFDGEVEAP
ncbi:MAG: alkaline phosphatase family protein [Gaiellales bacterium]